MRVLTTTGAIIRASSISGRGTHCGVGGLTGGVEWDYCQRFENPKYRDYLERHFERYTSSPDGVFVGVHYDDEN
jgi:hypothetical protein